MVGSSRSIVTTGNVAKPIICKEVDGEFEEGNYDIYEYVTTVFDSARWIVAHIEYYAQKHP